MKREKLLQKKSGMVKCYNCESAVEVNLSFYPETKKFVLTLYCEKCHTNMDAMQGIVVQQKDMDLF